MPWQINPRLLRSEPLRRCGFPDCRAACCLYGVWVDLLEKENILAHANEISGLLPSNQRNPNTWFETNIEADPHTPSGQVVHTRVLVDDSHYGGSSCIFLQMDNKCTLQMAGEKSHGAPWLLKPFYCILHPLDLDDTGRITLDETRLLAEEEASCLVPIDQLIPLMETFEPELRYFLGEEEYLRLLRKHGK